jgi:hypothetical protein
MEVYIIKKVKQLNIFCSVLMLLSIFSVFGLPLSANAATKCSNQYEPSEPIDAVHFNWGSESPDGVCEDSFSATFQQEIQSDGGDYFIQAYADDQAKVDVDGKNVIDWQTSKPGDIEHAVLPDLSKGKHTIKTMFNNKQGDAAVYSDVVPFGSWLAYYYSNTGLQDSPVNVRTIEPDESDQLVDHFDPDHLMKNVPKDNFSARYVTAKHLNPGDYIVQINTSKGINVLVDGKAVAFDHKETSKIHIENKDDSDIHWIEVKNIGSHLDDLIVSIKSSKDTKKLNVEKGDIASFDEKTVEQSKAGQQTERPEITQKANDSSFKQNTLSLFSKQKSGGSDTRQSLADPNIVKEPAELSSIQTYREKVKAVHHNWGKGGPKGFPNDHFEAVFDQTQSFSADDYFVQTYADDGVRVKVDGNNKINRWSDSPGKINRSILGKLSGTHSIETDYYENTGNAVVFSDIVPFDHWLAYYYNNEDLKGNPVDARVVPGEGMLNEDNGKGSPI